MVYSDIFLPVKKKINQSIVVAAFAQILKLSVWLILIWVMYALKNDSSHFPILPLICLLIISIIFYVLRVYAHDKSHYAAFELEEILRKRLVEKINQLPLETARNIGSGNLIKVLIDDIKELHAFVADAPPLKAEAIVTPIFTLLVLFIFNWLFACLVLFITLVSFVILSYLLRKGHLLKQQYNEATVEINSRIIEYIQGMNAVRTFDAGEGAYSQYRTALTNYSQLVFDWLYSSRYSSKIARSLFSPMLVNCILIIGLSFAYMSEQVSFTTIFSFLLLTAGIAESIYPVMGLFQILEKSKAAIDRIFEVESLPFLTRTDTYNTPSNNEILFKNVYFSYQNNQQVLSDINLRIIENSFTVFIGNSGSGKTTLANLIPRFLDVEQGSITLGGIDIKQIEYNQLISKISLVPQDNFLFSCSIADNIRYGLDNITDQQVIEAAQKAEIHNFIMSLPQQYQTLAGERGQLLSGGQKQRIAIARTFLQNRPIIILDEPTAFSDAINEVLLLKAFTRLIEQHKTVIMITHRLSSAIKADQIIFLEQGKIIAQGHHDDLIKSSDKYQALWQEYQQARNWTIAVNSVNNEVTDETI
ncbi:ABC transporter ATP-binding protein [Gilliamella sp. wkB112]|uniref:ABC transporter ATP-binding protein n=1 Tax=Gilliamella sp. wkB112 TaxID=3120257 RepID=UPI00080E678D|nr:ABC transporter ATP-binding protein [Gilliamella apicola]OCG02257.1 ABC transporter permease [Gilliamella apicola]